MYRSLGHLCADIGVKREILNEVASNIGKYYRSFEVVKFKPDGKPKENKDGSLKCRKINPSIGNLKLIQQRLNQNIFSKISFPSYVHGGVRKRDNLSNAEYHKGNKFFFQTDIKKFFPHVSSSDVYHSLISIGFSENLASKLTKLTTYEGHLPQGAPTSTTIANIVFIKIDKIISQFCDSQDLTYTRFVDDITISGKYDFKEKCNEIVKIISGYKYKIARDKTVFKVGRIDITGVSVGNNYLNVSQEIYIKLDEERSEASKAGLIQYKKRVIRRGRK